MDLTWFNTITWIWIGIGVLVFPLTLLITAPFGRHFSPRYGPAIGNRKGWILMESPAIWWFTIVFLIGLFARHDAAANLAAWLLWMLWMVHYVNRGLIFPFRIRTTGKLIPILLSIGKRFFECNGARMVWRDLPNGMAVSTKFFDRIDLFYCRLGSECLVGRNIIEVA